MVAAMCLASASALAGVQAQQEAGVAVGHATLIAADRTVVLDGASAAGAHAIRLQDAQGGVVREVDLLAFLPASYVHNLPREGEALRWWRTAKLDAARQQVFFSVPAPGSGAGATGPGLEFSIDLRDGSLRTAQIREYLAAVDASRALDEQAVAAR
jgi:hypothetical protein